MTAPKRSLVPRLTTNTSASGTGKNRPSHRRPGQTRGPAPRRLRTGAERLPAGRVLLEVRAEIEQLGELRDYRLVRVHRRVRQDCRVDVLLGRGVRPHVADEVRVRGA